MPSIDLSVRCQGVGEDPTFSLEFLDWSSFALFAVKSFSFITLGLQNPGLPRNSITSSMIRMMTTISSSTNARL
jgi:hypothetical protein